MAQHETARDLLSNTRRSRLRLAVTAAAVLTVICCSREAAAQFRFGGGGGGLRLPFGGQIQPRNLLPSRQGNSNPSLPGIILGGGSQSGGNRSGGSVAGQVAGALFKRAVEPSGPQVSIPGLGELFTGPAPKPGQDFVPLPGPRPKKSVPEILIPLLLNPPPFHCVKPPCEPRPVLPSPVRPIESNPEHSGDPQRQPLSEIQRVAAAAKRAFQNDSYDEALELANRMNDLAPKNSGVLQFRAAIYQAQMKYAEAAIDTYNALLAGPIWTRVNIKDVYRDPTAYQRDVKWLTATTNDAPEVLAHQFLSAYHAHVAKDWTTCRTHLQKMLTLKPGEVVATKLLAKVEQETARK